MDSRTAHNLCLGVHLGGPLNPTAPKARLSERKVRKYIDTGSSFVIQTTRPVPTKPALFVSDTSYTGTITGKMQRKLANFYVNSLTGAQTMREVLADIKDIDERTEYEVAKLREVYGDRRASQEPKIRVVPTNWSVDDSVNETLFEEQTKLAILASLKESEEQEEVKMEVPESEDEWELVDETKSDSPQDAALFSTEADSFVQLRKSFRAVLLENNGQSFVLAGHGNTGAHKQASDVPKQYRSVSSPDERDHEGLDGDANLSGMSFDKYLGYKKYAVDRRLKRRWRK